LYQLFVNIFRKFVLKTVMVLRERSDEGIKTFLMRFNVGIIAYYYSSDKVCFDVHKRLIKYMLVITHMCAHLIIVSTRLIRFSFIITTFLHLSNIVKMKLKYLFSNDIIFAGHIIYQCGLLCVCTLSVNGMFGTIKKG